MTDSSNKPNIIAVLNHDHTTKDEKIAQLLKMHEDARAEQRAVTEGGMVGEDGEDTNLREIELALHKLGVDPDSPEQTGAATL